MIGRAHQLKFEAIWGVFGNLLDYWSLSLCGADDFVCQLPHIAPNPERMGGARPPASALAGDASVALSPLILALIWIPEVASAFWSCWLGCCRRNRCTELLGRVCWRVAV